MIAEHLLAVECPTCGADIGDPCHTWTGHRSTTVHVARQNLVHQSALEAEPSLDDDRRLVDMYAAERVAEAEA